MHSRRYKIIRSKTGRKRLVVHQVVSGQKSMESVDGNVRWDTLCNSQQVGFGDTEQRSSNLIFKNQYTETSYTIAG